MDGKDRRLYQRITIGAISQFLMTTGTELQKDFEGVIDNICEDGIGISVNTPSWFDTLDHVGIGDELYFQGIDEYVSCMKKKSDVFIGKAQIVRMIKNKDNYYLGCSITSNNSNLQEYIRKRKIAYFIDSAEASYS